MPRMTLREALSQFCYIWEYADRSRLAPRHDPRSRMAKLVLLLGDFTMDCVLVALQKLGYDI